MDINHLHLAVQDVEKSRQFYNRYFGFKDKKWIGEMLFMENEQGFELALDPMEKFEKLPDWFHFGFKLEKEILTELYSRLSEFPEQIEKEYEDYGEWGSFACTDPDGHGIEVYWDS